MNAELLKSLIKEECLEQIYNTQKTTHIEVDQKAFREGMSNLGAAVNVITTSGPAGVAGFTASAVHHRPYWCASIVLHLYLRLLRPIKCYV